VLDYYGRRLATCSSDRTVKIYEVEGETHRLIDTLKGHDGPVWQVSWAHPKYGNILASASYDGKVIIWQEKNGAWGKLAEHANHQASVNSVQWAPHEVGAVLACASSDGKISVLEFREDGSWDVKLFQAHAIGCNAVAWAPATSPGSIVQTSGGAPNATSSRRFVTGGSDNLMKIWSWNVETGQYQEENTLQGHSDWVRDVAWAPSILPKSYIASASQDKTAIIWASIPPVNTETSQVTWQKKVLQFDSVVWRVSWSLSGNTLAISGGDNKVTVWRENLKGEWEQIRVEESA